MMEDRQVTVRQAAQYLSVTETTVRRWLLSGRLRGVRLGGTKAGWRIPEQEVVRLLQGASSPTPSDVVQSSQ